MDYSSEDESDISDSEIPQRKEKAYLELKFGIHKVKSGNGIFRCPFCHGKKKQDYHYKDLLQHSSGISSSNRKAKVKANHLALTKFLKNEIVGATSSSMALVVAKTEPSSIEQEELFVWPWMGILVNLPIEFNSDGRAVGRSRNKLKEQLSRFNPLRVHPQWSTRGHTGTAVVDFKKDWDGFKDAMAFERYFEAHRCGKKDWHRRKNAGRDMYGWVARVHDYKSPDKVGDYLRRNGDLKTVSDISKEQNQKTKKLVANLANEIEVKNKHLHELECKYSQTNMSLDQMMKDLKKMQDHAHDHSLNVIKENEKLKKKLDTKRKEFNLRCEELNNLVGQTDMERKKLEDEKEKAQNSKNLKLRDLERMFKFLWTYARMQNALISSSLELAIMEQKKSDERVSKLLEEHKREKEKSISTILELERELDAKQKLQLEIEQLRGKIEVMKHMESDEESIKKKMEEMQAELDDKIEEQQYLEKLNSDLLTKQVASNNELQEARKQLIKGLKDTLNARTKIGIKRMGAVDEKAFQIVCKERFAKDEADVQASMLCSQWEEHLRNPDWHPFKVITVDGKEKEILKEDDAKLASLRENWGDAAYKSVVTALLELNEYNPSGRYIIPELWNFKEDRKASIGEVIAYILQQWKTNKRKRG
ncbi:hypothetical protein AXF42_Ash014896 [Apostasia shenzhenica]|uniref:Uncharacterized protein n=1 Tax=Apostasia shenzhenica TaxID=1088818 RepID=A0A2I0ALE7_9ASPA|nr:hypothetical protein AXF42_Ash014896 [Apostasia shenzhenica]